MQKQKRGVFFLFRTRKPRGTTFIVFSYRKTTQPNAAKTSAPTVQFRAAAPRLPSLLLLAFFHQPKALCMSREQVLLLFFAFNK